MIYILIYSVLLTKFVIITDSCLAVYDMRSSLTAMQKVFVFITAVFSVYCLGECTHGYWGVNYFFMVILLVIAVEDAMTGYVYNIFGISCLILTGIQALFHWPGYWMDYEVKLLMLYMGLLLFISVFKWMAPGDLPVYMALMLYYIVVSDYPMVATIFMYLLSQLLFAISLILARKKQMPLLPAVYMAHLATLSIWT